MKERIIRCPNCGKKDYKLNPIGEWYCYKCGFGTNRRSSRDVDQD